mmetsp:Transcript_11922/g.44329  ORF Transcript_11922/g.44329 Transcript_11922/m.44329 type:complete len:235 (-) Transcript_11922:577-1281(-)
MTSPMAYTFWQVVRSFLSTTIRPYLPRRTPSASSPMPSVFASRPPEYSTRSTRRFSFFFFFLSVRSAKLLFFSSSAWPMITPTRPSERRSMRSTGRSVTSKIWTRSRCRRRRSLRRTSCGRNGRNELSLHSKETPTPRRASTVAYSTAMTPPPKTAAAFGKFARLPMPVLSITTPGVQGIGASVLRSVAGLAGREPVARQTRRVGSSTHSFGRHTRTLSSPEPSCSGKSWQAPT